MKYLRFLRVVRNRHLDHVLRPKVLRPLSTVPIAATTGRHQLVKDEYPVGRKLHGFTVQRVAEVPELCLTAVSLSHDVTGASHLHLARDDRNNVFCVGFRTTPLDSTGVPHILEHTTLCGSHKYPCRDPFFKMLNRSLSTFMNAFTASDFTMYPFSTQNPKDFKNLLHVYLDAVFHPLLRPLDFLQEGWRLEHSTVNDPKSPIVFKGVVFNEMKGALADCERLFAQHLQSHMLPSHTYSYVSGGDPLHIPDLSWEQLKRFHETHYHPSNAWFYTYGDFHLDDHLKTIDEEVLSKFDRIKPNTSVPDEIRWQQPRRASVTCRPEPLVPDPDRQTTVAVSYLLENITNSSECLALHVLSTLLVEGPNAPFYKSLLEPNIGSGFSPASGYNNQMKEAVFSVGLQGIHSNDVNKVVEIIDRTIEDVIKDGFPDDRIEAILHGIELGFKHQTSNYGLGVIMSLSSPWNHGADPIEMLQINRQVDNFKQQLRQNPRFLQDKMRQYLKDNRHRLILVMNPDEEYGTKRKAAEERILNEKLCKLKESDKQVIYQQGLELNAKQSEVDDLSSLPTLKLSDVERTVPVTTLEHTTMGGVQIQFSRQPTNGLTHLRGVLNCRDLKAELKPLLPLFCQVVTKMGAGNMDYRQLAQKIDMRTGGLSVSTLLAEDTTHDGLFEEGISFYSHCLEKNSKDMFYLWSEIFNGSDLSDVDRLRTLVNDILVEKASGLPDSGHLYAMTRAAGTLNPLSALKETFQGLEQIKTMKLLAQMDKLDHLVEQLRTISKHLMTKNHLRLSINVTHDYMPIAQQHLSDFVSSIRGTPSGSVLKSQDETFISVGRKQHIVLPLPVNFVSHSIPAVRFNHEDFASLRILSRLMTTKFLHREIREKGGAYGGGATANSSGLFTFYSYRDPRSLETLETFDLAETWATTEGTFSDRDIKEAKLSVFSEVDRPVAAGDKGSTQFLHGITDEMKQRHRDRLQQVSRENLHHVAATYLVGKQLCSQVILGPENNSLMGDWEAVKDDF